MFVFIVSLGAFFIEGAWASGIDDIANYKSPPNYKPPPIQPQRVVPYTEDEFVLKLVEKSKKHSGRGLIVAHGLLSGFQGDERFAAFNQKNFGRCSYFYLNSFQPPRLIQAAVNFATSSDEKEKADYSEEVRGRLEDLKEHCGDEAILDRMKSLINKIVDAAIAYDKEESNK